MANPGGQFVGQFGGQFGQPIMAQPGSVIYSPRPGMMMAQQPQPYGMTTPAMSMGMAAYRGSINGGAPMNNPHMAYMPSPPMPHPQCPPGLQYLAVLDHLFVKQTIEEIEIMTGCETKNSYQVFAHGFLIYWAQEESDFCSRQFLGAERPFTINMTDGTGQQCIRLTRPFRGSCCLCWCCLQEMTVEAPVGRPIGSVEQLWSMCGSEFICKDLKGMPIFFIEGPPVFCRFGQVEFRVLSGAKQEIGRVTKQWSGLLQEAISDADQFGVSFPANMPVESKADFMYFESKPPNHHS